MPPECAGPLQRNDLGIALESTVVANSIFVHRIRENSYPGLDCANCGPTATYPCEDISKQVGSSPQLWLGDIHTGGVYLQDFTSTGIQYAGAGSYMADAEIRLGLQGSGWRHWLEIDTIGREKARSV